MASQVSTVAACQAQQLTCTLDQERERWFDELRSYQRCFEAEKEKLQNNFQEDQQNLYHDLEKDTRFIESQGLTRSVYQLFMNYQAEIRTRRLSQRKQAYETDLQDVSKRENRVYCQHQEIFPLSTGRRVMNNIISAPMPAQQNRQWQGYAQASTQLATPQIQAQHASSPRHASIYQQSRPMNQPAEVPLRMLPSNGRPPALGNSMSANSQSSAMTTAYSQPAGSPRRMNLAEVSRGTRIAIPPMKQVAQASRINGMHMTRNNEHFIMSQGDDLARQIQHNPHQQLKRKSESSELTSTADNTCSKRARPGTPQSIARFTIQFSDVYQDGKAKYKHTIVKFEDIFYILKCDEHGVHFKQNALAAAAKHLHGASHNHQKKEHRLALRTIGFHVVDCNDDLMRLNNLVVQKAFEGGYKPLNQLHGPKSGGKRDPGGELLNQLPRLPSTTPTQSIRNPEAKAPETTQFITDPQPGELYYAKWTETNKMYVVAALGWTDLSQCGWMDKFCDLPLYKQTPRPSCFKYNEEGIAGWAEGFGDGEPRVLRREVPVMWFEETGDNQLGWVNVQLLRPFQRDDPNRPSNPDASQNRARKWYAAIRGYSSYEDMLAGTREVRMPTDEKASAPQRPSSASESESMSHDVDMNDFGDNLHAKVDDSNDENYTIAPGIADVAIPSATLSTPPTPSPQGAATEQIEEDSVQSNKGAGEEPWSITTGEEGSSASRHNIQTDNSPEKSPSVPTNGNREESNISTSPSTKKETSKFSPKLQVATHMNMTGPENEKPEEQPSADSQETLTNQQQQPLASPERSSTQSALLRHPAPAKPHIQVELKQHESSATTPNLPPKPVASKSTGAVATLNREDDQVRENDMKTMTNDGRMSSGSSTPRIINFTNKDLWRAVRKSESPLVTPATIRAPTIDRSAAASPVDEGSRSIENFSIDVGSFSEGDRTWDGEDTRLLHFYIEDHARGVARSRAADGMEAILDAQQVKTAHVDKTRIKLILKTGVEQRLKFTSITDTGIPRGGLPQATKFYRWFTGKNADIEHLE